VLDNEQAFATTDPQTGLIAFQDRGDTFATIGANLTGDTTRFSSFGPFQGRRFNLGTLYGAHLSGDFEADILEYRLDFRGYKQLTRRSLFAFRAASIYNAGERENSYGFGGLNQLRGFGYRDFAGSRLAWMNLELRFPLVDDLRMPILELGQIRGFLFLDVGAAWFRDDLWFDPETGIIRQEFLLGNTPGAVRARPVPFDFWDSEENRLQDGRASYGWGFQFLFVGGLQFNWVWANPLEYTQFVYDAQCIVGFNDCRLTPVPVDKSTRSEFYIAFDF
jgi:outer membrane protein assembly factor BamA